MRRRRTVALCTLVLGALGASFCTPPATEQAHTCTQTTLFIPVTTVIGTADCVRNHHPTCTTTNIVQDMVIIGTTTVCP